MCTTACGPAIIATLRKRFPKLGNPLTARDSNALDLDSVLALPKPDNKGPPRTRHYPMPLALKLPR